MGRGLTTHPLQLPGILEESTRPVNPHRRHPRARTGVAVALPGHDVELEPLVGLDECIGKAVGVRRVHVVVDVAGDERQVRFRFFASSEFFSMLYSKVTLPSLSVTSLSPWCFSLQVSL